MCHLYFYYAIFSNVKNLLGLILLYATIVELLAVGSLIWRINVKRQGALPNISPILSDRSGTAGHWDLSCVLLLEPQWECAGHHWFCCTLWGGQV